MKKRILITGASNGIGNFIFQNLKETNKEFLLTFNKDEGSLKSQVKELKNKDLNIDVEHLDITSSSSVDKIIKLIRKKRINVIINNAAISQKIDVLDIKINDWSGMLFSNLQVPFLFIQAALPEMIKLKFGRIINISSIGGQIGGHHQLHYAAAKAGLINLTKSMSRIYSSKGIHSFSLAPGLISTKMLKELNKENLNQLKSGIPIGSFGKPEQLAALVNFLCSDDSEYMCGNTFNFNGGMHLL